MCVFCVVFFFIRYNPTKSKHPQASIMALQIRWSQIKRNSFHFISMMCTQILCLNNIVCVSKESILQTKTIVLLQKQKNSIKNSNSVCKVFSILFLDPQQIFIFPSNCAYQTHKYPSGSFKHLIINNSQQYPLGNKII